MAKIRVEVGQQSGEFEAADAKAAPVLTLAGRRLGIDPALPVGQRLNLLARAIALWLVEMARVEQAQEEARAAEARARNDLGLE